MYRSILAIGLIVSSGCGVDVGSKKLNGAGPPGSGSDSPPKHEGSLPDIPPFPVPSNFLDYSTQLEQWSTIDHGDILVDADWDPYGGYEAEIIYNFAEQPTKYVLQEVCSSTFVFGNMYAFALHVKRATTTSNVEMYLWQKNSLNHAQDRQVRLKLGFQYDPPNTEFSKLGVGQTDWGVEPLGQNWYRYWIAMEYRPDLGDTCFQAQFSVYGNQDVLAYGGELFEFSSGL